jgi:hypothetical protein
MTALAELAQLLQRSSLELPTLSDDEVAALAPLQPAETRLVPLVTHAGLDETQREARIVEGEQSLIDRGLLVEHGDRVAPADELRAILAVRDAPLSVTMIDVAREGTIASCYAYGLGNPSFLLTETVEAGEHDFAVSTPGRVAAQLAAEIDPDGSSIGSEGLVLEQTTDFTPPGWDAVERAAAEAEATVTLYAAHRTAADRVIELDSSIAVTADEVWLVAGELDTRTGDGKITGRRLSRPDLEATLRSFLVLEGVVEED